ATTVLCICVCLLVYFKGLAAPVALATSLQDNLGKFDPKFDKGTFIGYSIVSKASRVDNSRTLKVEESIHATSKELPLDDEQKTDKVETSLRNRQMKSYHFEQQVIGNIED
ncbi:hypothetical protein CR513_09046, partial [Mucuna pruriens]